MAVQEGKPISNESIMTASEWKERTKKYPETSNKSEPPAYFKSEFDWRYKMGGGLSQDEIKLTSSRLDEILKKVRHEEVFH